MLDDLQRKKLQLRFALLDTDGDGRISQHDYELVCLRLCSAFGHLPGSAGYERVRLAYLTLWERLRARMDHDGSAVVTLPQFLDSCAKTLVERRDGFERNLGGLVDTVFDLVDGDANGLIDLPEYSAWMHAYGVGPHDTLDAFDLLDSDGDGAVTKTEMAVAAEQFYRSTDPEAAGNWLFGPL
ncbi:MAG: EF-hand domain-containing protein [Actinocrinis sp.]